MYVVYIKCNRSRPLITLHKKSIKSKFIAHYKLKQDIQKDNLIII